MKVKIVLVTGGGGYIGSHAVERLLKEGCHVVVFDNFFRGYREPLELLKKYGDLTVIEGDLQDASSIQSVFDQYTFDVVFHFAALCLVDESVRKPDMYFKNNVDGTMNLLQAMHNHGVRKLIFSSTCAVYGDVAILPVAEDHVLSPVNPYGDSKRQAEVAIKQYADEHDMSYVILRYFNVCGASTTGEIGDSKKPSQLLVQNAVRGAIGIAPFELTCSSVDTPDGTPIRDYIDVEDLVDAHIKAYDYLENRGENNIFNLGNGNGWSVQQIVQAVNDELGVTIDVQAATEKRQGEYPQVYADITKAQKILGWQPQKSLSDSIQSLKKWYENFPNGYLG